MAWIDRKQFDKVVSNLLSNAFKYSQDGGQITVTLSSDGNNANLLVADTGIGFGSENTDKLFERFYQGRNTSLSHLDGTGIGLNLSRSIVLLHGGKIDINICLCDVDGEGRACAQKGCQAASLAQLPPAHRRR